MIHALLGIAMIAQAAQPALFTVTPSLPRDWRWQVARVIAGECQVGLLGHDAAVAVAWVVRNRVRGEGFAHGLDRFNGRGIVSDAEIAVVDEVFMTEESQDPTAGALWVMGGRDVVAQQFRDGDQVFTSADGRWEIHIYKRSPFER